MYNVKFTSAYKKSYKLMKKRGADLSLLDKAVDTLRQGKKLDEKYHDHGLNGKIPRFPRMSHKARLAANLSNRK